MPQEFSRRDKPGLTAKKPAGTIRRARRKVRLVLLKRAAQRAASATVCSAMRRRQYLNLALEDKAEMALGSVKWEGRWQFAPDSREVGDEETAGGG